MQSGIDSSRLEMSSPLTAITLAENSSNTANQTYDNNEFFGKNGPCFRDLLDAINPLNHIPIISTLFSQATEHKASTASRLAGGALLGGPVGFAASLMDVVFEYATGSSTSDTIIAALGGGGDSPTLPTNTTPTKTDDPSSLALTELAPNSSETPLSIAQTSPQMKDNNSSRTILDLYGGSADSKHSSYKKAQMLPYLRDVNVSHIL